MKMSPRMTGKTMNLAPFTMNENGTPVTCYPVTFDGRKVTVHTENGPRTRTRRNCGGYATAAMLRAMGYTDMHGLLIPGTDDAEIFTRRESDTHTGSGPTTPAPPVAAPTPTASDSTPDPVVQVVHLECGHTHRYEISQPLADSGFAHPGVAWRCGNCDPHDTPTRPVVSVHTSPAS
jgi:hypothetical protein